MMSDHSELEDTTRPLDYFDKLLQNASLMRITNDNSTIVYFPDLDIRVGHITSLLPLSRTQDNGERKLDPFRFGLEASGFLALLDFNSRRGVVSDHHADGCNNLYFTVDYLDTRFSPIHAAGSYHALVSGGKQPTALIGAARSVVSSSLAILGGVYETPQMSATSTSATLDAKDQSPYFARTVPNNRGDAHALVLYLNSLGVSNFGVVYVRDNYGSFFHKDVVQFASQFGMQVVSAPYDSDVPGSLEQAIQILSKSKFRYFFAIPNSRTWEQMLRIAYRAGIAGQTGYVWLLSESTQSMLDPNFKIAATDVELAKAIHGVGVVVIDLPSNQKFERALQDLTLEELAYYVSRHAEPELFDGFDFAVPGPTIYQYLNYDAVMAVCLAACQVEEPLFSGAQLYQSILDLEFQGVSGTVRFNNETGTRSTDNLVFVVQNVFVNDTLTATKNDDYIHLSSNTAVLVDLGTSVQQVSSYIYAGDPQEFPPLGLPYLEADLNLIPKGLQILGWTMAGLVMLMSIAWFGWTVMSRNVPVVKASQPAFLCMLCLGTLIMASSIIPMGLQEPISQRGLDIACMSTPWLLSVGFVTAFSALFSKTWRLNRVFKMSRKFRRVNIQVLHVLLPFVVFTTLNITILTLWTILSPLQWTRVETSSVDQFGRSNESYGTCKYGSDTTQTVLAVLLAAVNAAPLLVSCYQAYKARSLPPSNFNESYYVTISLASLLEAFLLAVPILVVVRDSPTAQFLMGSILVIFICLAILLPLFIPKYARRKERPQAYRQSRNLRTSMYIRDSDAGGRSSQFSFDQFRSFRSSG